MAKTNEVVINGVVYVPKNSAKGFKAKPKTSAVKSVRTPEMNLEYLKKARGYKFNTVTVGKYIRKDGKESNVIKANLETESGNVPMVINAFTMWRA